ncbi:VOC family protein [Micromonospora sp. NPDC126480]|uniref:VOC family protein n=1 Tax=Micromonospora sp. NPDC126480 TaxID=3155312 RepID=UPI0033306470
MPYAPVVISLPIADRAVSYRFYPEALGLTAVGEPAGDGIPEPLQFVVNDGLRLMLIPTGGFGWVTSPHQVAAPGTSECLLSFNVANESEVDAAVERARAAGAEIRLAPGPQPWGYAGTFADPDGHLWMVTVQPQAA